MGHFGGNVVVLVVMRYDDKRGPPMPGDGADT